MFKYVLLLSVLFLVSCNSPAASNPFPVSRRDGGMGTAFTVEVDGAAYTVTAGHMCAGSESVVSYDKVRKEEVVHKILLVDNEHDVCIVENGYEREAKKLTIKLNLYEPLSIEGYPYGIARMFTKGLLFDIRQTDSPSKNLILGARAWPGNSGSPVFNADGEVVGMAIEIFNDGSGLTVAVPASVIKANILKLVDQK